MLGILSLFILVNSLVIICCLIVPGLQELINRVIAVQANEVASWKRSFTYSGLMISKGASASIITSIYFLYYAFMRERKGPWFWIFTIGLVPVALSLFLIGRSGFVTAGFFWVIGNAINRRIWPVLAFAAAGLVMVGLAHLTHSGYFSGYLYIVAAFALEPIIAKMYPDTSVFTSGQNVLDMLYLPPDENVLLFGLGTMLDYVVPFGKKVSDSGYVRMAYEHGLVIELAFIGSLLVAAFFIRNRDGRCLYLLFLSAVSTMNVKEPFLFKPMFFQIFCLFLFIGFLKDDAIPADGKTGNVLKESA